MNRRSFVGGAAAVTVTVAGGGVWRAYDQGVFSVGRGPAYEPWTNWNTDATEGPFAIVSAAILAANPHNTQPWFFRVTETWIDLYADTKRNLGSFDPYLREMHLGLGCALENMALAAAANGYEAQITLSQGTLSPIPATAEPALVARINLVSSEQKQDGLYAVIAQRHTNRGPYDIERSLPPEAVATMQRMADGDVDIQVFTYAEMTGREQFADVVIKATEAIIADPPMVKDSEKWFRHNWDEVQQLRDGVTLDTAGLSPLVNVMAKVMPAPSAEANHQHWLDATRDVHVATAPVFGLIAVRDLYDLPQTLRAGRLWQRMHLWATSQGFAMQPLNQPVEMVDRERQLKREPHMAKVLADLTGEPGWKPTFAFRAGYPEREALASPRRPLEEVVI
jgi:hypothetical protein